MTIACGTRPGPHEFTTELGEGGMGEVFRATDSKLEREAWREILPADRVGVSGIRTAQVTSDRAASTHAHSQCRSSLYLVKGLR